MQQKKPENQPAGSDHMRKDFPNRDSTSPVYANVEVRIMVTSSEWRQLILFYRQESIAKRKNFILVEEKVSTENEIRNIFGGGAHTMWW